MIPKPEHENREGDTSESPNHVTAEALLLLVVSQENQPTGTHRGPTSEDFYSFHELDNFQ